MEVQVANGKALSADELLRLPTDPTQLEARLRALLRDAGLGLALVKDSHGKVKVLRQPGQAPRVTGKDVFDLVTGWLASAPLTRELQAALYGVLAGLPGVRQEGSASDNAGRRGVAIAWNQPTDNGDGALLKSRLIINPATGELLGTQDVIVRPAPSIDSGRVDPTNTEPAGTIIAAQAFLARHWTEGPGPGGWPTNPRTSSPPRAEPGQPSARRALPPTGHGGSARLSSIGHSGPHTDETRWLVYVRLRTCRLLLPVDVLEAWAS